jgi:hypothetical protein
MMSGAEAQNLSKLKKKVKTIRKTTKLLEVMGINQDQDKRIKKMVIRLKMKKNKNKNLKKNLSIKRMISLIL